MNTEELQDIMNAIPKIDMNQMDLKDQALFINCLANFAEQVKPLVIKYSAKMNEPSKFLFRM